MVKSAESREGGFEFEPRIPGIVSPKAPLGRLELFLQGRPEKAD
jgi:hypothetical protein